MSFYGPEPSLVGKLSCTDFPNEGSVTVKLSDGSIGRFKNAFYHREGAWIAVYSEHAGYYMFKLSCIDSIMGHVRTDDDRFALL